MISSSFLFFSRAALTPELKSTLDKVVQSHKVVLFMKGTKDFPQCGFSNTVMQILKLLNVPFETLNILENEMLRQGLKEYSNWPTFPQLYIDGEFFGGCDITVGEFWWSFCSFIFVPCFVLFCFLYICFPLHMHTRTRKEKKSILALMEPHFVS